MAERQPKGQVGPLRTRRRWQVWFFRMGIALIVIENIVNFWLLATPRPPLPVPPWTWAVINGLFAVCLWLFGTRTMARYGAHAWDEPPAEGTAPEGQVVATGNLPVTEAALLVVHGIGVQERFETSQDVVDGLTKALPPHERFRMAPETPYLASLPDGCAEEDRAGIRLERVSGSEVQRLDVYELFWADMAESVLTWKGVLSWGGRLWPRIVSRLDYVACGSRYQPHPDDIHTDKEHRKPLIEQVRRDGVRKARHELGYLVVVLLLAGVVFFILQAVGRIGLSLAQAAQPLCSPCGPWLQLWLAYGETPFGELINLSKQSSALFALIARFPVYFTMLAFLTGLLAMVLLRLAPLLNKRRTRFLRIIDVIPEAHFLRMTVRESARPLNWLGSYLALLGGYLALTMGNPDLHRQVFGLTCLLVVAVVSVVGAQVGKTFLARYLADIPIQGNDSSYSAGRAARSRIHRKAVCMLRQLLAQYGAVAVLAHSQGTVLSYEALHLVNRELEVGPDKPEEVGENPLRRLKAYVTIGVALSKVHEIVQGRLDVVQRDAMGNWRIFGPANPLLGVVEGHEEQAGLTRWYNYWLVSDLVANPVAEYLPVARDEEIPWNPRAAWSHSDYWTSQDFYDRFLNGPLADCFGSGAGARFRS